MAKKITAFKTKGMNRDLSVSAFNPEFSFENMNLRLSTNEGNTLMSWVNERGPLQIGLDVILNYWENDTTKIQHSDHIEGSPVGTAVINSTLVLFTHDENGAEPDYIYSLQYIEGSDSEGHPWEPKTHMLGKQLYNGDLNFSTDYPLETLVSYEAEHIQKVYWTDGINQPRVINIAEQYMHTIIVDSAQQIVQLKPESTFDFVPELQLGESVTIERNVSSGGAFPPGVIQYCFTYINKYRQQSNVAWVSSLYYLTHDDRGASPEDFVTGSFKITISSPDDNFDYLRLYSIQRTSIDGDPIVKLLDDIEVPSSGDILYVDNGTTGATLDPFELLYVGGKEITAKTLADSNNTLFLGNITSDNMMVDDIQRYFDSIRNTSHSMVPSFNAAYKSINLDTMQGVYKNTNMMSKGKSLANISTYKGGEKYRFGFQLQKKTGEWSEPVFIKDVENGIYPGTKITGTGYNTVNLVTAQGTVNFQTIESNVPGFNRADYKSIRPVAVFPNIGDRQVICQGVLNPTVFNPQDRIDNSPFAQSSWFFRPYMANDTSKSSQAVNNFCTLATPSMSKDDAREWNASTTHNPTPGYYYVIFVNIPENYTNVERVRESILNRRYLKWTEIFEAWYPEYDEPQKPIETKGIIEFKGAIKIDNQGNYALFSTSLWKVPGYDYVDLQDDGDSATPPSQYYRRTSITYDEGVTVNYLDPAQEKYDMSNALKVTSTGFLYNDADTSTSDYIFYFFKDNIIYEATFDPKGTAFVVTDNMSGNAIAYTHYESLVTEEGISDIAAKFNINKRSAVEIQGSKAVYTTNGLFASRVTNPMYDANSQFFVDQSIVTMHSPDIEFDTEVQNFGLDNVKLRIVGAVPITSNASAHSIRTSSPMLEKSHNQGSSTANFGVGEKNNNIIHRSDSSSIDGNAGNRLVADYLWNDVVVNTDTSQEDKITTSEVSYDYLIYPWQRTGSLNNDTRSEDVASSYLKIKKMSNILYSYNTAYLQDSAYRQYFSSISAQMFLTENDFVMNMRLPQQKSTTVDINYYPNIDKVLYNTTGYNMHTRQEGSGSENVTAFNPVSMKYKSTSHAVIALNAGNPGSTNGIAILPYGYDADYQEDLPAIGKYTNASTTNTVWGDTGVTFNQKLLDLTTAVDAGGGNRSDLFGGNRLNFLWIGELYRDVDNPFGGTSKSAVRSNKWVPAGEAVPIPSTGDTVTLNWTEGDTFYQRYDCLKTYPFTNEDPNQLVEILSFMCETKVNIDGRYDRNRGQMDNTNVHPMNFNLLNPVYSQRNNFFPIRQISQDAEDTFTYPNLITYSKTKTPGADVDLYTNVTLASNLDMDGDKGEVTALRRFNDQLIVFQDTGIARIIYNVNAAIATTAGVPIEIANSGKVEGKQYFSDTIGCSNRDSMVTTPYGIYFMDSHDKGIYLFNGQLANLSTQGGMNSWVKGNMPAPEEKWNPVGYGNFKAFYDRLNQDVLFVNAEKALAWSEKLQAFTSFYSYGYTPYFVNLANTGLWIRNPYTVDNNGTETTVAASLWKHNAGGYCNFFGTQQPYWMTLVGNPEPQADKIFTNLELRASVEGDGTLDTTTGKFTPSLPFDFLETWDEYQHGYTSLENKTGGSQFQHGGDSSSLKRKFRIWRCDIPRNNALLDSDRTGTEAYDTDEELGISRKIRKPLDRMRNPWLYMKLKKNAQASMPKAEVHDVIMTYFS